MCWSPEENVAYEFFLASSTVPCMSCCSSYVDGLWDGSHVAVLLLFCGMLFSGLDLKNEFVFHPVRGRGVHKYILPEIYILPANTNTKPVNPQEMTSPVLPTVGDVFRSLALEDIFETIKDDCHKIRFWVIIVDFDGLPCIAEYNWLIDWF